MHPYNNLPDKAFWRRMVVSPSLSEVDPVGEFTLAIQQETKVATAGSCFAQHIARHLENAGFNYYVAEAGHPVLPPSVRQSHNYGVFSARYGNIYTARQLLQLFQRAYSQFEPKEPAWVGSDGRVLDPFRPTVQPNGFVSTEEMEVDRKQHFSATRKMFETLDVFVFTLGLTECWVSNEDGAVFPLCPGVEGGVFSIEEYSFYNQTVDDVVSDMSLFVEELGVINPEANLVLTVSPVPLVATAESEANILSATTYSKSVLRVAADMLVSKYSNVHYFPSYEVITGHYSRGRYFAEDLRSVTEEGVEHVMRLFIKHATSLSKQLPDEFSGDSIVVSEPEVFLEKVGNIVEVECDEIALDKS